MKKTMFVKLPKGVNDMPVYSKTMVRVCAWCPRDQYPILKESEEYTHGLCEKHYKMLKSKHKTA